MIGKFLNSRYHIAKQLSSNKFGRTFVVEDRLGGGNRLCIAKQLKPTLKSEEHVDLLQRIFEQEVQPLYLLGFHPQLPKMLAYFEEDYCFYIVREYVVGNTLDNEITPNRIYAEVQVVNLLREVLDSLSFAHQRGVMHLAIRPSNLIQRKSDGKVMPVDFSGIKHSLASEDGDGPEEGRRDVYTGSAREEYVPDEQLAGIPQLSSDVYSLGIIGIEALTGITAKDLRRDESGEIIWPGRERISPELAHVIDRMVHKDFRQRFQNAAEAFQALNSLSYIAPRPMTLINAPPLQFVPPQKPSVTAMPPPTSSQQARDDRANTSSEDKSSSSEENKHGPQPGAFSSQYNSQSYEFDSYETISTKKFVVAIFLFLIAMGGISVLFVYMMKITSRPPIDQAYQENVRHLSPVEKAEEEIFKTAESEEKLASKITYGAKTGADWEQAALHWINAINALKKTPVESQRYMQAQTKLDEDRNRLASTRMSQAEKVIAEQEQAFADETIKSKQPNQLKNVDLSNSSPLNPGRSYLTIVSSDGDAVGKGLKATYTSGDGTFSAEALKYGEGLKISFTGNETTWQLSVIAPERLWISQARHNKTTNSPSRSKGEPGLDFRSEKSMCENAVGGFQVSEVRYDAEGKVAQVVVTFVQSCSEDGPPLFGRVIYDYKDALNKEKQSKSGDTKTN